MKLDDWKKPLSKNHAGVAGKVYFLNYKLIFPDKDEWTKSEPLTVNPIMQMTFEKWARKNSDLNPQAKLQLGREKRAEMRDPNGVVLQLWFSEEQAPYNWGDKTLIENLKKQGGFHVK